MSPAWFASVSATSPAWRGWGEPTTRLFRHEPGRNRRLLLAQAVQAGAECRAVPVGGADELDPERPLEDVLWEGGFEGGRARIITAGTRSGNFSSSDDDSSGGWGRLPSRIMAPPA